MSTVKAKSFTRSRVLDTIRPVYNEVVTMEKMLKDFGLQESSTIPKVISEVATKRTFVNWYFAQFGIDEKELSFQ